MLGCASTGLAASVYENFDTAHSLFKIPVVTNEEDFDFEHDFYCDLDKNPQRKELLQAADIFIWDEISSQSKRDFEAVYKAMHGFNNKVLILIGDKNQIAPVVLNGGRAQIINASIYTSANIERFTKVLFTTNLRLQGAHQDEIQYSKMLLQLGTGSTFRSPPYYDVSLTDSQQLQEDDYIKNGIIRLAIQNRTIFISGEQDEQALLWLHPNRFDTLNMHRATVLAGSSLLLLLSYRSVYIIIIQ